MVVVVSHWSLGSIPMSGASCIRRVIHWYHHSACSSEDTRVLCWILNQACSTARQTRAGTDALSGIEGCPRTDLISNTIVNYSLSSPMIRIELPVGVS